MKKAILIGDSIRMAYQPVVASRLSGKFEIWGPAENGGTSKNVLAHLDEWAIRRPADIVHVNCGLHDLAIEADGRHRVEPNRYEEGVREILTRLKAETGAHIIWATTTPVDDELHHRNKSFDRGHSDVMRYNEIASGIANELGIEINDLHAVVQGAGVERCLKEDGVHMTDYGNGLLADAVTSRLERKNVGT